MMINEKKIKNLILEVAPAKIVAATKYVGSKEMRKLYNLGIDNFGENRVDAFLEKFDALSDLNIVWHFIGHLQSKKVRKVINKIAFLHSLDRISLADEIEKRRIEPLNCFVEVNISNEESKTGLRIEEVNDFCKKLKKYDKIKIVGLMGMAHLTSDFEKIYQEFDKLVKLKKELNESLDLGLKYLSMGMSNDYKEALKLGATHVRLGSILFREEE